MTNVSYTYQSALGTLSFCPSGPYWITALDGETAVEVDLSESRGPGQAGSSVSGQSVAPRELTLCGCFFDPVAQNRARLLQVAAPCQTATLTRWEGTGDTAEGWSLAVLPVRTPEISDGEGVQSFQLRLRAAFPYWRSTRTQGTQLAGLQPLFRFPFFAGGTFWLSRFSGDYFKTVTNTGNVPVEFTLTLTARAQVENPEITHMGTKRHIRLERTVQPGERITVSTIYGEKGVTIAPPGQPAENGFPYLALTSDLNMSLLPGANLLRVDAATGRQALSARLTAPVGVRSGV